MSTHRLQATCIAIGQTGILLRGPSGSGKSDLALRLMDTGTELVADDQVLLSVRDGLLYARCPASIQGLLEVRGLGIIRLPFRPEVQIRAIIDLLPEGARPERLPEPETETLLGIKIPRFSLNPFHASASARVRMIARVAEDPTLFYSSCGD
ncbi:MAG: HPr kinase/phosphatase C-terminal domain-containing protein [Pseudomonadota bacterium]|nr:HPr kinase/phosphatase C-terminal domain-containing protein [Pseudomonadota bacterium]